MDSPAVPWTAPPPGPVVDPEAKRPDAPENGPDAPLEPSPDPHGRSVADPAALTNRAISALGWTRPRFIHRNLTVISHRGRSAPYMIRRTTVALATSKALRLTAPQ